MKLFIIPFLIASGFYFQEDSVLICTGSWSGSYHKTYSHDSLYCQGLVKCTRELKMVSKDSAVDFYNRVPCGFCFNKK